LAFKIIAILHNTLFATFWKLSAMASLEIDCRTSVTRSWIAATSAKRTSLVWRLRAPDQGSTVDFILFPRLKSIMKGARFVFVAAIEERVTTVLRLIPKEAFANSFQKLY
jgi:hypothetical protein